MAGVREKICGQPRYKGTCGDNESSVHSRLALIYTALAEIGGEICLR